MGGAGPRPRARDLGPRCYRARRRRQRSGPSRCAADRGRGARTRARRGRLHAAVGRGRTAAAVALATCHRDAATAAALLLPGSDARHGVRARHPSAERSGSRMARAAPGRAPRGLRLTRHGRRAAARTAAGPGRGARAGPARGPGERDPRAHAASHRRRSRRSPGPRGVRGRNAGRSLRSHPARDRAGAPYPRRRGGGSRPCGTAAGAPGLRDRRLDALLLDPEPAVARAALEGLASRRSGPTATGPPSRPCSRRRPTGSRGWLRRGCSATRTRAARPRCSRPPPKMPWRSSGSRVAAAAARCLPGLAAVAERARRRTRRSRSAPRRRGPWLRGDPTREVLRRDCCAERSRPHACRVARPAFRRRLAAGPIANWL